MHPDKTPTGIAWRGVRLRDLERVSVSLLEAIATHRMVVVDGEMGAGKTTLIKSLCSELGVDETMSSPTFSIVNEYQTKSGDQVYHFDFYRIKSEREAADIGAEEYFYSGNYCFVEWAEKIPSLLPELYAHIRIVVEDEFKRTIELVIHGRKEEKRI